MSLAPQHKDKMPIFDAKGRYAYAFLELALEENTLPEQTKEIAALLALLTQNQTLRDALENPAVSLEDKSRLAQSLADEAKFSARLLAFIKLIIEKGRANLLASIAETFLLMVDIHNDVVLVDIRSAETLTDAQQKRLQKMCAKHFGEAAKINFVVDKSLLGGVALSLPDRTIDATIAGRLAQLKENFKTHFQTTLS